MHEALVNGSNNGSHFNWKNQAKEGQTALMAAAYRGHAPCVAILVMRGADAVSYTHLTLPTKA